MTTARVVRNFLKMTPGSFAGSSRAATPAKFRPLGAMRRFPAGTFSGESKVATPSGCPRNTGRVTDQASGVINYAELLLETGDPLLLETGDPLYLEVYI